MIRVVVADDEPPARRRVVRFLKQEAGIDVVAECAGGAEAVERIKAEKPDLVFLDVQMPDITGIEVVEQIGAANMPAVVFVTAYDQYAIRAFELNAVDYLLKPYDAERFKQALDRARTRIGSGAQGTRTDELRAVVKELIAEHVAQATPSPSAGYLDRIAVRVDGSLRIVRASDVDWLETEGNYVRLHIGRASHLIRVTAADLERQLDPKTFARIHRRYLINLDRVAEVQPWFAGDAVVILTDGTKLRLARSHRAALHARLLGDKHPDP